MKLNCFANNNEKKIPKNSKEYFNKYNIPKVSSHHQKTKTETNIFEENLKAKYNLTKKSISTSNSQNSFFPENSQKKTMTKNNSVYLLGIPSKSKNANTKNSANNIHLDSQELYLKSQNCNCFSYLNSKRNTPHNEEKEFPIKKTESISNIQHKTENHSLDYHKNINTSNKSVENSL